MLSDCLSAILLVPLVFQVISYICFPNLLQEIPIWYFPPKFSLCFVYYSLHPHLSTLIPVEIFIFSDKLE